MSPHYRSAESRRDSTVSEESDLENSRLDELCSTLLRDAEDWQIKPGISYELSDSTPPFECFAAQIRSYDAKVKIIHDLQVGDELCVRVKRVELAGIYVQPLCVLRPFRRNLAWIEDFQILIGRDLRDNGLERPNDLLKGQNYFIEVSEISFKNSETLAQNECFNDFVRKSYSFSNANLSEFLDLNVETSVSLLSDLRDKTAMLKTKATYLRRKQNEDLSMRSVVKGVEMVRAGQYTPAIQHFFKALEIYDRNIEALVGRAAAYANMGKYELAENDLDAALAIRSDHSNAKNYMVEVLIKAANQLMESKDINEAKKKYEKILKFKEDKRALDSLKKIKKCFENAPASSKKKRLNADEIRRRSREIEKEREQRRSDAKKLAEMERFIAQLRGQKDS
uniref:TPR_REGION domain-containing protein n=1 Tax=Syphacia muris TaxID=451379 RepID=A0A0N5APP2_9BILA